MTAEEAATLVRHLTFVIQKARSNVYEMGDLGKRGTPIFELATQHLLPWTLSEDKTLLHALLPMCARLDRGEQVVPAELFNVLVIATRLEPSIGIMCAFMGVKLPSDPMEVLRNPWTDDLISGLSSEAALAERAAKEKEEREGGD